MCTRTYPPGFEISRIVQSLQYLVFCKISNENKLEVVTSRINFNAILLSNLYPSKLKQYKNTKSANFVYHGKSRIPYHKPSLIC